MSTYPPMATPPISVSTQLAEIRADIQRDWYEMGVGRHWQLTDITARFQSMPASDSRAVFDALTDAQLTSLGEEVNEPNTFGVSPGGGLTVDEKRSLFVAWAEDLSGQQLRVALSHFRQADDGRILGEAIATHASADTKLAFIESTGAPMLGFAVGTEHAEGVISDHSRQQTDYRANAVAEVLAGLEHDGPYFDNAVAALDRESTLGDVSSLTTVLIAGEKRIGSVSEYAFGPLTLNFESVTEQPDTALRILDAANSSTDEGTRCAIARAALDYLKVKHTYPVPSVSSVHIDVDFEHAFARLDRLQRECPAVEPGDVPPSGVELR
jgi:hypothetical protein